MIPCIMEIHWIVWQLFLLRLIEIAFTNGVELQHFVIEVKTVGMEDGIQP